MLINDGSFWILLAIFEVSSVSAAALATLEDFSGSESGIELSALRVEPEDGGSAAVEEAATSGSRTELVALGGGELRLRFFNAESKPRLEAACGTSSVRSTWSKDPFGFAFVAAGVPYACAKGANEENCCGPNCNPSHTQTVGERTKNRASYCDGHIFNISYNNSLTTTCSAAETKLC